MGTIKRLLRGVLGGLGAWALLAAGSLTPIGSSLGADWPIGPLRLHGLDGFERLSDDAGRAHLRSASGVDVIISILSVSAKPGSQEAAGSTDRRMNMLEEGARETYESTLHGGERVVPITRENLANGSTLISGAIRNSSFFHTKYFLIYVLVAPAERIAVVTVEGDGKDTVEQYKHYRELFDSASWQPMPSAEELNAFTDRVADRLRARLGNTPVDVKGPLTLSVGELQANLDRVFSFCNRDAAKCDAEIERYVAGVDESIRLVREPVSRDDVRLVVRTTEYFARLQGSVDKSALMPQPRKLAEGLVVLPAADSPKTIRILISAEPLKELNLSTEELYRLGDANLRKSLKPIMQAAKPVGKSQIGSIEPNQYNSGRLALVDSWAPLAQAQGGVLIVCAPATDTILYISEDTPSAIDALRELAKSALKRAPNPLSDKMLRWTSDGWQEVP
jgi:hypothetical protein